MIFNSNKNNKINNNIYKQIIENKRQNLSDKLLNKIT